MNKLDFDIKKLLVDGIDLDYFDLENASAQEYNDLRLELSRVGYVDLVIQGEK